MFTGTAGATLRELRASTGALLSLGWDNASQYTYGAMKIGGLRPCRQQAQLRINELISNIHSKTIGECILRCFEVLCSHDFTLYGNYCITL